MDAVLYKLLTSDKQARIYVIDNTDMINESDKSLSGDAALIFNTVLTFTSILHGMLTTAKRVSVKMTSSDPSLYMVFGADANGDVQGHASDELVEHQHTGLKPMRWDNGCLKIVRDNGTDAVFTGIVEIIEDDISDNLSRYLLQSEQTESVFRYFCDMNASSNQVSRGVLVQALPFADKTLISEWKDRLETKRPVIADCQSSIETLIKSTFSGATVVEKWPIRLKCSCDRQAVLEMLMGLGVHDLEWSINEDKDIEVRCGKCGKRYGFGADEIRRLINS